MKQNRASFDDRLGRNPPRGDGPPLALWVAILLVASFGSISASLIDWYYRDGLFLPHSGTWFGRDFTNLYLGGRLAFEGIDVYNVSEYQKALRLEGILAGQNYSYPPATLLLGKALSMLPYEAALYLWSIGGLAAFILAARPYIRFHWLWLLLIPAAAAFPNGQWGLYAAALWLWSFRGNGVGAAFLTMKPHLGLLLPPALLARQRWHQIVAATVGAGLVWLIGEWATGLTLEFLTNGAKVQLAVLTNSNDQPYFAAMPSTYVVLRHVPFAATAHLVVAGPAMALCWRLRDQSLPQLAFPLATATFLILPYSFAYDMGVVSLGFAILLNEKWAELNWPRRIIAGAALMAPAFPAYAPPILLAGLYLQHEVLLKGSHKERHLECDEGTSVGTIINRPIYLK